jgi:hypothetical protein
MPYCVDIDENGCIACLNRELQPLGYNQVIDKSSRFNHVPIYTKYKYVRIENLIKLGEDGGYIMRNQKGEVVRIYLYGDSTNPTNYPGKKKLWANYSAKLEYLSKLKVKLRADL